MDLGLVMEGGLTLEGVAGTSQYGLRGISSRGACGADSEGALEGYIRTSAGYQVADIRVLRDRGLANYELSLRAISAIDRLNDSLSWSGDALIAIDD